MSDPTEPPITEPTPAPEIYVEGFTCSSWGNGVIKFPFFSVVTRENGTPPERRIVARLTMPITTVVGVHKALGEVIALMKEQGIIIEHPQAQH